VLIDDRMPSDDGRQPIEVNWRVVGWLAAAAILIFAGIHATGFVAYLIVCATVYAICRAVTGAVDYWEGLREWRQ
jgi:hypothetical protein